MTIPAYFLRHSVNIQSSLLALILCTFHLTTNFFLKDLGLDQHEHVI
jgi:hypothetical protein